MCQRTNAVLTAVASENSQGSQHQEESGPVWEGQDNCGMIVLGKHLMIDVFFIVAKNSQSCKLS